MSGGRAAAQSRRGETPAATKDAPMQMILSTFSMGALMVTLSRETTLSPLATALKGDEGRGG